MTRRRAGTVSCRDCAADLEHCHGVAIIHPDGVPDCTETPPCGLPVNAHWASVLCIEIRCDCVVEELEVGAAS